MVKIEFFKSGKTYFGFRESGHANFDDAGKDIVCAAISAMTMLIINTVEVCCASDIKYDIDEKTTDITVIAKDALPQYCKDEKKQYAISKLFEGYFIQLNDMLEDYYDYLDVTETQKSI
jgi:hypothetical protein